MTLAIQNLLPQGIPELLSLRWYFRYPRPCLKEFILHNQAIIAALSLTLESH